jgi:TrmH family RNA methyltransferase
MLTVQRDAHLCAPTRRLENRPNEYHNNQPDTTIISSRQHPLCKLVRSLHSAKGRREHGLFLIEGINSVGAALRAQWPLKRVLVADDNTGLQWSRLAADAQVPVQVVAAHLLGAHERGTNAD